MPLQLSSWDDPAGWKTTWDWGTTGHKYKLRDPLPNELAGFSSGAGGVSALQMGALGGSSSGTLGGGSAGGGGGAGTDFGSTITSTMQQAAKTADPWAEQRGQYQTALNQLMQGGVSAVANDPSVQARQQAGEQTLARSMAARGFLGSGNILQELQKQGQNIASEEYGNQFNRLAMLAGVNAGSPTSAAGILAQIPNQQLGAQQQAFSQNIQAQKLPYELTALQQGGQLGQQQIAAGDLQQQALQDQLRAMRDAQTRLSIVQQANAYPKGFLA